MKRGCTAIRRAGTGAALCIPSVPRCHIRTPWRCHTARPCPTCHLLHVHDVGVWECGAGVAVGRPGGPEHPPLTQVALCPPPHSGGVGGQDRRAAAVPALHCTCTACTHKNGGAARVQRHCPRGKRGRRGGSIVPLPPLGRGLGRTDTTQPRALHRKPCTHTWCSENQAQSGRGNHRAAPTPLGVPNPAHAPPRPAVWALPCGRRAPRDMRIAWTGHVRTV